MSNIFTKNDEAQRNEVLARVNSGEASAEDYQLLIELNKKFSDLKKSRALDLETIKEQVELHKFTLEDFFTANIFVRPAPPEPIVIEVEKKGRKPRTTNKVEAPKYDESKRCVTIESDGKDPAYSIYSTAADEALPQYVPNALKRFYEANPETFKTRLAEHMDLTAHGVDFFDTEKGVLFIEKLENFAKEGKVAPPANDESTRCITIKPEGKGRSYSIYSTDAEKPLPQFLSLGLKRFYDVNPETFKTRLSESTDLTAHGKEFFNSEKGQLFIAKLEKFAKEGKLPPAKK